MGSSVPNLTSDPVLNTSAKIFEENLVTVTPSASDTTGIPTASAITNSASSPGTLQNFEAAFQEETELYEYLNNATSGPNPDGSPGAYDATQSALNNLPVGNVVHEDATTGSGMGLPYAAILSSDLKTMIAGGLPVTLSNQNYTVNPIAWQHGKYPNDPAGQPASNNGCTGADLYTDLTFSAAGVSGLQPNTVYAAYLLVRDTDVSGPLSNHLWYFETPPAPPSPSIYLGYADNYYTHGIPNGLPWDSSAPDWNGITPTNVIGCGVDPATGLATSDNCPKDKYLPTVDSYDAGAIELVNPSSTATMAVTGASVTIGACTYNPWPGLNATIPAGGSLVLTQTGGTNPCPSGGKVVGNYNFDTSEALSNPLTPCVADGLAALVSLTANGNTINITDTGQILNDGGIDPGDGDCGLSDEYRAFTQVYP